MACACFSWCDSAAIQDFRARLPKVESPASPWYSYLQTVYGEESPRLPIDLKTLGFVVMPATELAAQQTGVPFDVRCGKAGVQPLPRCSFSECKRWLQPIAHSQGHSDLASWSWSEQSARRARLEPIAGVHVSLPAVDGVRMRYQYNQIHSGLLGLYMQSDTGARGARSDAVKDTALGDHAWVEVFRAADSREGINGYGCRSKDERCA